MRWLDLGMRIIGSAMVFLALIAHMHLHNTPEAIYDMTVGIFCYQVAAMRVRE